MGDTSRFAVKMTFTDDMSHWHYVGATHEYLDTAGRDTGLSGLVLWPSSR